MGLTVKLGSAKHGLCVAACLRNASLRVSSVVMSFSKTDHPMMEWMTLLPSLLCLRIFKGYLIYVSISMYLLVQKLLGFFFIQLNRSKHIDLRTV